MTTLLSPHTTLHSGTSGVVSGGVTSIPTKIPSSTSIRSPISTNQNGIHQQRSNSNGFGSNVSRLKSVFFDQGGGGGGEPPPPPLPPVSAQPSHQTTQASPPSSLSNTTGLFYASSNRSRSLSTPRSDSSPKLVTTIHHNSAATTSNAQHHPTATSSLSSSSGSIVLNRIHLLNNGNGAVSTNMSCSTSSLVTTKVSQSPPQTQQLPPPAPFKLSPNGGGESGGESSSGEGGMLISSDHLTRFQSAKALFARMEEESARQLRRNNGQAANGRNVEQQPPHSNIFLIKSKFEAQMAVQRDHSVGAAPSSSTNTRRSLAFGVTSSINGGGGLATSIGAQYGSGPKLDQIQPRKRLTMGPIITPTNNDSSSIIPTRTFDKKV